MGHINGNYDTKWDFTLKTEYIKIKKMSKNKQKDFIPLHKMSLFHAQRSNKILHEREMGKQKAKKHYGP